MSNNFKRISVVVLIVGVYMAMITFAESIMKQPLTLASLISVLVGFGVGEVVCLELEE
jgi:hypothetical protein